MSDYNKKETIVHAVAEDDGLQFYWTMLSIDVESEEQAVKLLKEIIGLWVTTRGFSIAGTYATALYTLIKTQCLEYLGRFGRGFSNMSLLLVLHCLFPQLPRTGSNAAEPCTRNETVLKQN